MFIKCKNLNLNDFILTDDGLKYGKWKVWDIKINKEIIEVFFGGVSKCYHQDELIEVERNYGYQASSYMGYQRSCFNSVS